ncbi:hypothetical protein SAMN02982994_6746 [Azospirillum lipoferum]|nr:hypothetical protein SAMN02982994_6746 [Azospirillum lipoferum]
MLYPCRAGAVRNRRKFCNRTRQTALWPVEWPNLPDYRRRSFVVFLQRITLRAWEFQPQPTARIGGCVAPATILTRQFLAMSWKPLLVSGFSLFAADFFIRERKDTGKIAWHYFGGSTGAWAGQDRLRALDADRPGQAVHAQPLVEGGAVAVHHNRYWKGCPSNGEMAGSGLRERCGAMAERRPADWRSERHQQPCLSGDGAAVRFRPVRQRDADAQPALHVPAKRVVEAEAEADESGVGPFVHSL